MPELTKYAKLYGVPDDKTRTKYSLPVYRSGYSPTRKPSERLYGFTAAELQDAGCLRDASLPVNELDNPIMTCLREPRWEVTVDPVFNRELYPVEGFSGHWIYSNPLIKPHLEKILRLTTLLLNKLAQSDLWYGLMAVSFKIPDARLDIKDLKSRTKEYRQNLYQFKTQKVVAGGKYDVSTFLNGFLINRLHLGFMDPNINPQTGEEFVGGKPQGVTFSRLPDSPDVWCYFSIEDFKPLLKDDLTNAERLSTQFACAVLIFHEVVHAAYRAKSVAMFKKYGSGTIIEPYFDNEQVAELGWSAENFIFGCIMCSEQLNGRPHICNFMSSFPTTSHLPQHGPEYQRPPVLAEPEVSEYESMYPIPVRFYEDIFKKEFWAGGPGVANTNLALNGINSQKSKEDDNYAYMKTTGLSTDEIRTIAYESTCRKNASEKNRCYKRLTTIISLLPDSEEYFEELENIISSLVNLVRIHNEMFETRPPNFDSKFNEVQSLIEEGNIAHQEWINTVKTNFGRPEDTATFDKLLGTLNEIRNNIDGSEVAKGVQIRLPINPNIFVDADRIALESLAGEIMSPNYFNQKRTFDICKEYLQMPATHKFIRAYAILLLSYCGMLLTPAQRLTNLKLGMNMLQGEIWKFPRLEEKTRKVLLELSSRIAVLHRQLSTVRDKNIDDSLRTLAYKDENLNARRRQGHHNDLEHMEIRRRIYMHSNAETLANTYSFYALQQILNGDLALSECKINGRPLNKDEITNMQGQIKLIMRLKGSNHTIGMADTLTLRIPREQTPPTFPGRQSHGSQLHPANSHLYTQGGSTARFSNSSQTYSDIEDSFRAFGITPGLFNSSQNNNRGGVFDRGRKNQ